MQRVNARDRQLSFENIMLSSLKFVMLNTILKIFIEGIFDLEIRKEVTREMIIVNRFFKMIYQLTKEIRRINIKIQKLYDEKLR